MRLGGSELLIILVLIAVLYLTRGRSLTKKIKEKKQAKEALKSGNTSSSASGTASASSSKNKTEESGDYKQTLKYAGVAFACIGLLFVLGASLVPDFAIYLYIAGGLFVGIGVVALIMLLLVSKKD